MPNKLPKIYQSPISPDISNNTKVFYSQYTQNNPKVTMPNRSNYAENKVNIKSVEETIQDLLKTTGYIFNIPVEIKTGSKTYQTYIATKAKNNLVTMDNEIIPIHEILSIKRKDR